MIRILRFLWTGSWHEHEWDFVEQINVWYDFNNDNAPRRRDNVCKCKHCGVFKTFKGKQ